MYKVIIAGGRDFYDYNLLKQKVDYLLSNRSENHTIEIVSGGAKGADLLGEKYANENSYKIKKFPADWDAYGKKAGFIRNSEMAEYADVLIAFWDSRSKGTKHMISLAQKNNLKIRIVNYVG